MLQKSRVYVVLTAMLISAVLVLPILFESPARAQEGSWKKSARMDEGKVLIQAAAHGTDVYVAGGSTVAGPRASFDLYDSVSDMWRPLPPMPTAREHFGMAAFSGRIYISGGRSREMDEAAPSPSKALWVYDTVSSDWVLKADMPTVRVGHTMISIGDKLYVLGGTGEGADQVYIYDVVTDLWTIAKARMPTGRISFGVAVDGEKIVTVGGISSGGKVLASVEGYDTKTGTWFSLAPLPHPRAGVAAAYIGGRLHIAGGSVPDPAKIFNEHFSRGPADASWRVETGLPTARHSSAYTVAGDKWIIIGGGAAAGFYTLFSAADAVEFFQVK